MLNGAKLEGEVRNRMWAECMRTSTILENISKDVGELTSSHEQLFGGIPKYTKHLRIFGELCIVAKRKNIMGKL